MIQMKTIIDSLQQAGFVGLLILIVAILGFMIAFLQLGYLFQLNAKFNRFVDHVNPNHVVAQLQQCCAQNPELSLDGLQLKLEVIAQQQLPLLERGLSILKLLAAMAPMLGLLGTVSGMIITFQTMATTGSNDPAVLAGGISMALITTILGLITAMPLLILHNLTQSKSKQLIHRLEIEITQLLALHAERTTICELNSKK